ncbi:hypothetical protein [Hyalangium sp.]|uniref:hypothetical protein n=1 Tax=Hyalangium sp. TaxID=2028555 RepID=UPI002D546AF2|nr:hypothetical protein [Hyalangium sp.]HYH97921.1 hypothetical protein [Hyalangium sp.]
MPTARLGVIFTARPEFISPWGAAQTFHLQLGRLGAEEVEVMVKGLTRGKALPAEVAGQVASWTDGIPLFVEELTRMVLDTGLLEEDEQQYRLAGPFSRLSIPGTLRSLLEARLDRAGRAKETAELASLLGREFSYEMLRAISLRDDRTIYCLPLLHELRAGILLRRGDSKAAEDALRRASAEAQAQQVRMLELRATATLCRLLAEQGRGEKERESLRLLLKNFSEQAEFPVLQLARSVSREPWEALGEMGPVVH